MCKKAGLNVKNIRIFAAKFKGCSFGAEMIP